MTEGRQTPFEKAIENAKAAVAAGGKAEAPSDIQGAMQNLQTQSMNWLAKRTR